MKHTILILLATTLTASSEELDERKKPIRLPDAVAKQNAIELEAERIANLAQERKSANIDNLSVHALLNFTKAVHIVTQRPLTEKQAGEARAAIDFAVAHLEVAIQQAASK